MSNLTSPPREFIEALYSLRDAKVPQNLKIEEVPAPRGIAPYAAALSLLEENDHLKTNTHGRFVILYDPTEAEVWNSNLRVVMMLHAYTEPEMASDPVIKQVVWDWLHEAFDSSGAQVANLAGTVTVESSQSFGNGRGSDESSSIEVRCSWSPLESNLSYHLEAWTLLASLCSGNEPMAKVIPLYKDAGRK